MSSAAPVPLVVDLDDTYLRTDMLYEGFWHGMGADPVGTVRLVLRNIWKRTALKEALAAQGLVDLSVLPVDADVKALCLSAKAEGRPVVLASASPQKLLDDIVSASDEDLFDLVIGTEGTTNLTGQAKADRLVAEFGEAGFDYVGDTGKDVAIWKVARKAYVARPRRGIRAKIAAAGLDSEEIGESWAWKDLLKGIRPHQWVKNILLFLPLLAAHNFEPLSILNVIIGVISFSAAASAIYIVNDLTDLSADRVHETKKNRAFAAGRAPIKIGMALSLALGTFALLLAAVLSWSMLVVILVYIVTTLAYSLRIKRVRWADVATLGALYTLRVVAGAVAAQVETSGWIIGFVFPIFLTLACVKRLTELAKATTDGPLPGRAYTRLNRDDLLNIGIVSSLGAGGVFVGYTFSETAELLYNSRVWLWLVVVPLMAWQARMIWTGWKGRQAYDPIVFALRDPWGLSLIASALVLLVVATVGTPAIG